jgi:hypothetical protein
MQRRRGEIENLQRNHQPNSLNAVGSKNTLLLHRKYWNAEVLIQHLHSIRRSLVVKGLNLTALLDRPSGMRTKEAGLIDGPRRRLVETGRYIEVAVLGYVGVIQSTVTNLVLRIEDVVVQVVDGAAEFVAHYDLPFSLLGLFHQIHNDNRRSISPKKITKVRLGGMIGRIDTVEDDGRFGHCHR